MKKGKNISAYDTVRKFEEEIARYTGSKYAVAVESCCAAIFLSLKYTKPKRVMLPSRTYPGVACAVIHAGVKPEFKDFNWVGYYTLLGTRIIDSALMLRKDMYKPYKRVKAFMCLSFHAKKILPIGRGGMILTDDYKAYKWLKKARFDGRSENVPLYRDKIEFAGWNMYMTPEQAARGLMLFDLMKNTNGKVLDKWEQGYPNLSKIKAYK